jgi:hypothetical protein
MVLSGAYFINFLRFISGAGLQALRAHFGAGTVVKFSPLEIGVFANACGRVIMTAQERTRTAFDRSFIADSAGFHMRYRVADYYGKCNPGYF